MRGSSFCSVSSLWIPSLKSSEASCEGAFGLKQWSRIFGKKKKSAKDILFWACPLLILIFYGLNHFKVIQDPIFEQIWLAATGILLLGMILFHLYFGWRSRTQFTNRILQLDFMIGVFLICLLAETPIHLWSAPWLSLLSLGSLVWFQLRTLEFYFWKKRLKTSFKDETFFWGPSGWPSRKILALEQVLALIAIFIAATLTFYSHLAPHVFVAMVLPAVLPWPQWCATQLLARAEKWKLICQNFSAFEKLARTDLFVFDQVGVLTSSRFKVAEIWIDKNDDYTEAEIKDVLRQLGGISNYPVANLVQRELSSGGRSLMKLQDSEVKENLGVVANFEDLQRQKTIAVLSGLTWHKILQHEISDEGMNKTREWKREKVWTTFLSLNRKVVAAIAWENKTRFPEVPLPSKTPMVVLSSQSHLAHGIPEQAFEQVCVNCLPIDRRVQRKYWEERSQNILDIKALWDKKNSDENKLAILMVDSREDLEDRPLGILDGDMNSAIFAVDASRRFRKTIFLVSMMMIFGAFIPHPGTVLIMYLGGLLWVSRSTQK